MLQIPMARSIGFLQVMSAALLPMIAAAEAEQAVIKKIMLNDAALCLSNSFNHEMQRTQGWFDKLMGRQPATMSPDQAMVSIINAEELSTIEMVRKAHSPNGSGKLNPFEQAKYAIESVNEDYMDQVDDLKLALTGIGNVPVMVSIELMAFLRSMEQSKVTREKAQREAQREAQRSTAH